MNGLSMRMRRRLQIAGSWLTAEQYLQLLRRCTVFSHIVRIICVCARYDVTYDARLQS